MLLFVIHTRSVIKVVDGLACMQYNNDSVIAYQFNAL